MKTTNLFVELIVIGVGFSLGVLLLFLGLSSYGPQDLENLLKINDSVLITCLLSVIYSLGIVVDRCADSLSICFVNKIRSRFYQERKGVLEDKFLILEKGDYLIDLIEYNRSRMRICRGWILNLLLLIPSTNIFMVSLHISQFSSYLLINLASLILLMGFSFSWYKLTWSEYEKLTVLRPIIGEEIN